MKDVLAFSGVFVVGKVQGRVFTISGFRVVDGFTVVGIIMWDLVY